MSSLYEVGVATLRWAYGTRVSGPATFDCENGTFPAWRRYVAEWEAIREESMAVGKHGHRVPNFHELMDEQSAISANDNRDWRMFVLKAYGLEIGENMAICPKLAHLIRETPEVISAALSFLAPQKHIPPHRGPFKGILRFHLMLTMPVDVNGLPAAVLSIDGREYRLMEGEFLLWDDTHEHEVWNRSDNVRVALLLDVWRPNMPYDLRVFSHIVVLFVQYAMRVRGVRFSG